MSRGRRRALVGLGIGLALADSSVVTLALPDILRQVDVEIPPGAWVLTSYKLRPARPAARRRWPVESPPVAWVLPSYNLWLALAAVPAAYVARRRPVPVFTAGTLV